MTPAYHVNTAAGQSIIVWKVQYRYCGERPFIEHQALANKVSPQYTTSLPQIWKISSSWKSGIHVRMRNLFVAILYNTGTDGFSDKKTSL